MKITLLIGSLSGGGAERVVCNLANYLAVHKHEITVLTVSDKCAYQINSDVRHIVLYGESDSKLPHNVINLLRICKMNKYLRKEKMDLYVTFLPKLTRILLQQKRFVKCPIILAERCDPSTFYSISDKKAEYFDRYYNLADGYVFQTEDARCFYISKNIDVSRSIVIPNAINPSFVREPYTGEKIKRIVGAGRLTEQKNFRLLIDAFAEICDRYPDYKLVIYGEGPLENDLIQHTKELKIDDRIEFPGYVDNLGDELEKSTMFVLSSNFEGMPNALMEAMALGLPCVSTDCPAGGSRFLINDGVNGLLIPVNDKAILADAMDRILSSEAVSQELSNEARKICEQLSYEKIYSKWETFLSTVMK